MIPLYYAYVAFSNLSMVSTVMGLYLEHIGFSLAGVGVLFGALQLGKTLLEVPTGFVADRSAAGRASSPPWRSRRRATRSCSSRGGSRRCCA